MSRIKLYSVGQLAEHSGITVRTLHHYDAIGLLTPSHRSSGKRRLYDRDNVLRLQQILNYRTLGMPLDRIRSILDDPAYDRRAALLDQRKAVLQQIARSEALIRGIDEALSLIDGLDRKDTDMTTLFGGFDPDKFANEAEEKWGKTDAWHISQRRTANYTKADWKAYHDAHHLICSRFAELAKAGIQPDDPRSMELSSEYAALINRWFYPCSIAHLGNLAQMYEADQRFRKTFDEFGTGTAEFVIQAFKLTSSNKS
ncbi:MAG: MerR family transcriptional regulator [Pseudomonadota bacterium]